MIGGFGEVGRKVVQLLKDVGEDFRVIDREDVPGVDLVANILDADVFDELDLANSKGVILALDSDTATLFATVIVKDLAPDVPVTVRVNEARNVEKIHRAGADYALSLSQVSGQILSRRLLGEEVIRFDAHLRLARSSSRELAGKTAKELEVRRRTGCSVVAVERGEELLVDVGGEFHFEEGDDLFICGSNPEIARFREVFES